jgi:hypothetical protein
LIRVAILLIPSGTGAGLLGNLIAIIVPKMLIKMPLGSALPLSVRLRRSKGERDGARKAAKKDSY